MTLEESVSPSPLRWDERGTPPRTCKRKEEEQRGDSPLLGKVMVTSDCKVIVVDV